MATTHRLVAIDLGASSGRAILGTLGDTLQLQEAHRFPNGPTDDEGTLRWEFDHLWDGIKEGIRQSAQMADGPIDSIGVDTWGVDYGLIGHDGELLEPPVHYRDSRTDGTMARLFNRVTRREVFETTGIQFIQLNTIFQLYAHARLDLTQLNKARYLLMIPDIFNYLMTGVAKSEFTDATTTQCYDPRKGDWAREMLGHLGIPTHMLPEIIMPGTVIGPMVDELTAELGIDTAPAIIAPACHDTGSAVAAVPATDAESWAYLSSGTWSLIGTEITEPIINDDVLEANFTNEGGVDGTFRFLKNIGGLWLLQETQRMWREKEGVEFGYGEIVEMAESAQPFVSWVDPDHESLNTPDDMTEAICDYCRNTGQPVPADKAALVRTIFESLAMKYRSVFDTLVRLQGDIDVLHIVGGGSANALLNQFTANALGVKVKAGPTEATAIGNLLVQAKALGALDSLSDIRDVVRRSFDITDVEPQDVSEWNAAYARWCEVVAG
jgi:rhamnulokinase